MSNLKIFLTFLRFGFLAWGGPVAQISMIREELVDKQKWISGNKFNRALAVYQALPGPEAHEMCVYMGMAKAGRLGGFLAGLGFMLPGFLLMLLLSYLYTKLGAASLLALFVGVIPAVTALITRAAHKLAKNVLTNKPLVIAGAVSVLFTLFNAHFILVFLICAMWNWLWVRGRQNTAWVILVTSTIFAVFFGLVISTEITTGHEQNNSGLLNLFIEGLKGGLLSFGGAYTAIPFLQDSMVANYKGIDNAAFLNSIGLSGVIPAPLIIFATFLGFVAGGFGGAIVITIGIFLPAFLFTLVFHKRLEVLIEHKPAHALLDGISAAVVGILIVTAMKIIIATVNSPVAVLIFVIALAGFYLWKARWAIPAIIIFSAVAGYFLQGVL